MRMAGGAPGGQEVLPLGFSDVLLALLAAAVLLYVLPRRLARLARGAAPTAAAAPKRD